MNSGLLSEPDFMHCVVDLLSRSEKISDSWELCKHNQKTYLCKKILQSCCLSNTQENTGCSMEFIDGHELLDDDKATVHAVNEERMLLFEYHVIYSESYSVPVLYFNVYNRNGGLLPLEQIWDIVPAYYRERLSVDKWTFLTQTEHPYLGRPFYQLHPCHTDQLMTAVNTVEQPPESGSNNYILGWLCAVGPVVLLNMSMEYGGMY